MTRPPTLPPRTVTVDDGPGPRGGWTEVGGLAVAWGGEVLVPRAWTVLQADWAAELSPSLPDGPILELCAGVGHIGLVAAARTGRPLVQVDGSDAACRWARRNAAVAGLADRVEVRHADLDHAVPPGERFPVVLADPPYVPSAEVGRFPEDPPGAIDGGPDGLAVARRCLAVVARVLPRDGAALVQLRDRAQAEALVAGAPPWRVLEVRVDGPDRAVALVGR